MITMRIRDGLAISPDADYGAYDAPVGTAIKFISEDGNEYHIVACDHKGSSCYDCVFNSNSGHPLSKLLKGRCGADVTYLRCYDRIYKPIDTILEDL